MVKINYTHYLTRDIHSINHTKVSCNIFTNLATRHTKCANCTRSESA